MTDNAFLYHVLEDGKWHGQSEIIAKSMRERGHGLTVHSRAADLRKKGCVVECELRRNGHGRAISYYRMSALDEPSARDRCGKRLVEGSSSASSNPVLPRDAADAPEHDGGDGGVLDSCVPSAAASAVPPLLPVDSGGTLLLFACEVDESAGLRRAYGDAA